MRGYSLGALTRDLYKIIYPVGICLDFDNNTNPNNAFPGTTWVQITDGRVVRAATSATVGAGTGQIGSTAGADSVTIAIGNLPSHSHTMLHNHGMAHDHGNATAASAGAHTHSVSGTAASAGAHAHTIGIGNTGQGSYASAGFNTAFGTAATSNTGAHTHSVSGTAASAGAHTHVVDIPAFSGNTGGASVSDTGATGGGVALNVMNSAHYYARWKRTA